MRTVLNPEEVVEMAASFAYGSSHDLSTRDARDFVRQVEAKVLERVELLRQCAASGQMSARQVVDHFGNEGQL